MLEWLRVAVQSWNPLFWTCLNIRHAGPVREKERCEDIGGFSQWVVCVCPPLQNSTITVPKKTNGGIQRQDPDLQQKFSTDRFRPDAVVLCPRCLQWIFVYSQISVQPLTPCQAEIWAQLPSHSVSQVLLFQSQTTPFSTCCYWTQKTETFPLSLMPAPFLPRLVLRKHSDVRITSLR